MNKNEALGELISPISNGLLSYKITPLLFPLIIILFLYYLTLKKELAKKEGVTIPMIFYGLIVLFLVATAIYTQIRIIHE